MSSPFKTLAGGEPSKVDTSTKKDKVKFTPESIRLWMSASQVTKKSSICALFVGHPKIGKSGVLLDCRNEEEIAQEKKLIIFELNSDQGCDCNRKEFHNSDPNIIVLNPREYVQESDGIWRPDYIATMAKIQTTIQIIKEDLPNLNLKAIGFDGLDIFLSEICESQMRLDENIDAAGGLAMRFWKNRNKYYYDVINMLLDIDVDKYFITHYAPRNRDDKTGQFNDKRQVSKLNENLVYNCQKTTTDKMHEVIEFTDETKIIGGKKKIKISATMVADRRSLNNFMDTIVIAETGEDGKVKWNGNCLLEKKWS